MAKKTVKKHKLVELDRISKMRDYANAYIRDDLKGMYTYYSLMTKAELVEKFKDPNITSVELGIVKALLNTITAKDGRANETLKTIHDNVFGKEDETIRLGGIGGDAIKINLEKDADDTVKNLSDDDLKAIEQVLLAAVTKSGK